MYKKIGIFGATGAVGREVTRALIDAGYEVVPFSRVQKTVAGVPTQQLGSLHEFDVIVSTVGRLGMMDQIPLIARAKADGVKRFVPSEFGSDHRAIEAEFLGSKKKVFEAVKEAQFPHGYTCITNGFLDCVLPVFLQVDAQASELLIQGSGSIQSPYTLRYDVGRVLAETFQHPEIYKDRWISVVNNWTTLNAIAEVAKAQLGTGITLKHMPIGDNVPILKLFELAKIPLFKTLEDHAPCAVKLADMVQNMKWSVEDEGKLTVAFTS